MITHAADDIPIVSMMIDFNIEKGLGSKVNKYEPYDKKTFAFSD